MIYSKHCYATSVKHHEQSIYEYVQYQSLPSGLFVRSY